MPRIHVEHGAHPSTLRQWFPAPEPDPFFDAAGLTALYGSSWTSVIIEEGGHALRHAFAASAIAETGLFDIEPLVGYAGPLSTPHAPREFLVEALRGYGRYCREQGIVAELIRFNPLLENDLPVADASRELRLHTARRVAYIDVHESDAIRFSSYPRETRNMVRTGRRSCHVAPLEKDPGTWQRFRRLHELTMDATGATPEWRLADDLAERLRNDARFVLVGALRGGELVSAAVVLMHDTTSYYLLSASVRDPAARRGANNAIIDEIAKRAAAAGSQRLGLGGGLSDTPGDALFQFKCSFGGQTRPFRVGFLVHDQASLAALVRAAEQDSNIVRGSRLFLRYRLAPAFVRGRMVPRRARAATRSTL